MSGSRPLATPDEVGQFLGLSVRTLAQWRTHGKGPTYCRVGRHVRYRWSDVQSWVNSQASAG